MLMPQCWSWETRERQSMYKRFVWPCSDKKNEPQKICILVKYYIDTDCTISITRRYRGLIVYAIITCRFSKVWSTLQICICWRKLSTNLCRLELQRKHGTSRYSDRCARRSKMCCCAQVSLGTDVITHTYNKNECNIQLHKIAIAQKYCDIYRLQMNGKTRIIFLDDISSMATFYFWKENFESAYFVLLASTDNTCSGLYRSRCKISR